MPRMVKRLQQVCRVVDACTIFALELVWEFDLYGRAVRMVVSDIQSNIQCKQVERRFQTTLHQQIT